MIFTRKKNKALSNSKAFLDMLKKNNCILAKSVTFVSSLIFRSVKSELKKLNDTLHNDG